LSSAKLAALHARLSLSEKLPLQTLARALVDPSADDNPNFNNANLAFLGSSLINYHTAEWLICRYPRLPMGILYEAMRGYAGPESLSLVAKHWGVESVAVPGEEVDAGLLQFSDHSEGGGEHLKVGHVRAEAQMIDKHRWRRGISSRVVYDDDFGDTVHDSAPSTNGEAKTPGEIAAASLVKFEKLQDAARAAFVRAVTGAIYIHCDREAAKAFVQAHMLSRSLPLHQLFSFKQPTKALARLCAREGFDRPVARLESETGRLSRTPVFVVGIYSGKDKLGEGAAASLVFARQKAAMNALKAWYLYSPGNDVRVPSDMLVEKARPWQAPYIDIGEII
jgi:dsRNA-specific ribonuclease